MAISGQIEVHRCIARRSRNHDQALSSSGGRMQRHYLTGSSAVHPQMDSVHLLSARTESGRGIAASHWFISFSMAGLSPWSPSCSETVV